LSEKLKKDPNAIAPLSHQLGDLQAFFGLLDAVFGKIFNFDLKKLEQMVSGSSDQIKTEIETQLKEKLTPEVKASAREREAKGEIPF